LLLRAEGAWIAHVGDSRAYRIRGGLIQQLTYDHSYAWEMARRLGIPPEELGDIKKNVIVRSLGPDPLVQVDVEGPYPLEDGDTFVLCSDGLSNLVPPEEIGAIAGVLPIEEAARFLIELANLRGGPDNITVLIIRTGAPHDSVATPSPGALTLAPRAARAIGRAWGNTVPWPISVLMLGLVLAVSFVFSAAYGVQSWATFFFATAVLAIGFGVIGLFLHTRKQVAAPEPSLPAPPKASVYRQYPIRIDAALVDRWVTTALQLKEQLEARDWKVDWAGYRTQADSAARFVAEGDVVAAFRHHCRALAMLAAPFNKFRPKEEAFRPKWETEAP
jgi:protein phosphatase